MKRKLLCLTGTILVVLLFISGYTSTKNQAILKEIKIYNDNSLRKRINDIKDQRIYMHYSKKHCYIIFNGIDKEYSSISEELSNNILTITFDSNDSSVSSISVYKVTSSDKFDTILLRENGENTYFTTVSG